MPRGGIDQSYSAKTPAEVIELFTSGKESARSWVKEQKAIADAAGLGRVLEHKLKLLRPLRPAAFCQALLSMKEESDWWRMGPSKLAKWHGCMVSSGRDLHGMSPAPRCAEFTSKKKSDRTN